MKGSSHSNQRGAALIVSLIFLLIMALMGLGAMRQNVLEERMAGAALDRNGALQFAEAALRDGEEWLKETVEPPEESSTGTPMVWPRGTAESAFGKAVWLWSAKDWESASLQSYGMLTGASALTHAKTQPRFFIETASSPLETEVDIEAREKGMGTFHYRITAHGTGVTGTAAITLEAIVPKIYK